MGPVPLGGSCEGGKVSTHYGAPSLVGMGDGWGGKLQSYGGECNNRGAEGKAERFPPRGSMHSSTRDACLLTCWGGRGLGAEAWASEIRSQGEDRGWLREHSLKGASAPQVAGRKSRKNSGLAEEARDHCFGVHGEKRFLSHLPTEGRALLK